MNLTPVFEPGKVAVVGVSLSNPFHPANIIYNKNFYGYENEVFAVNPRGGTLERRRVFESVSAIPGGVDMAVLAVRAPLVPDSARQAVAAGASGLFLQSAWDRLTAGGGA